MAGCSDIAGGGGDEVPGDEGLIMPFIMSIIPPIPADGGDGAVAGGVEVASPPGAVAPTDAAPAG